MIETITPRQAAVATVVRVLVVFETVAFLLAALLHLGERIPLGFAVLATDRILPAAIVEGLAGLVGPGAALRAAQRARKGISAATGFAPRRKCAVLRG
jgi:hypothetical protein